MKTSGVKRDYKDRLFRFIFSREENKAWTLELYNAVSGRNYKDPNDLVINTIEDAVYMGMKNDLSFIIEDVVSIYEQQSSPNPNMPVRMMGYLSKLYDKHIKAIKANKYGTKLIKLPTPKLVVFYNGRAEEEDSRILRLSDSFINDVKGDVEVTVKLLNINYGRNEEIMNRCKPLYEYSRLVAMVNENKENYPLKEAIDKAIDDLPDDYVIKGLLEEHRAEVQDMLLTEYNEEETMELFKRDARLDGLAEGRAEGLEEGRAEGIRFMLELGVDKGVIMSHYSLSNDEIDQIISEGEMQAIK